MPPTARSSEAGFTLVEITIAMVVLLVGVLGTLSLVDGANRSSAMTRAREGSTNLNRDVVETVRTIRFTALAQSNVQAALQAQPGLADADAAAAGWQVVRRGTTYTLGVTVCTVDDPEDGIGSHVAGGFCSNPALTNPVDDNPADMKRVTVSSSWSDTAGAHTTRQSTLIATSDRGPAIEALDTNPAGQTSVADAAVTALSFRATAPGAASVEWYLDGVYQGAAGASGGNWAFAWSMGAAPGSPLPYTSCAVSNTGALDGTYFVSARAFDVSALTAGPRVTTVSLNRCPPLPVGELRGGRNPLWNVLDVQWNANREEDVVGYYVERRLGASDVWRKVATDDPFDTTCDGLLDTTYCSEPDIDSLKGKAVDYRVIAVDRDGAGNLREATVTGAFVTAGTNNNRPVAPVVGSGGTGTTLSWAPTGDPDNGDYVDFYRVYRAATPTSPDDRYDVVDNAGSPIVWSDPDPTGGPHTYRVTAVDSKMAESPLSNAVGR